MNPDDRPHALTPSRVEWVPSSPEAIEVRVFGTWHGPTVPPAAELVVGAARFAASAVPPGDDVPPAWSASFLVPVEARAAVEDGSVGLDVGGWVVALPAAAPGRIVGGTLVDPAVLAERRARRAELAEESAASRAASAEHTAETLRTQLGHLEERLARAADERDALAARVADAERRLRLAEQREEAERRRRGELEEELAAARREAEAELHDLHDRLASAEEVTEALERALADARHREETERVARARVDERLREALARVAELEGDAGSSAEELRRQAEALAARLAEAESERVRLEQARGALTERDAARAEAEALRRRLEEVSAEAAELRRRLADVEAARTDEAELLRRVEASETAMAALRARLAEAESGGADAAGGAALREALAAAEAERDELRSRLERESHARRLAVQRTMEERAARLEAERSSGTGREAALAAQVAALEAELAQRAETHARVQAAIETVREELVRVRAQVDERRVDRAAQAEIEQLDERGRELEARLLERDRELHELRAALADARTTAASAERLVGDLRARLADAEQRRSSTEHTLHADFEARIAQLTDEVVAMRGHLAATTRDFEQRLAAERARREAAEAALDALRAEPSPAPDEPADAAQADVAASAEPAPGDVRPDDALDTLLAGLRAQVDAAREQLEEWEDEAPAEERQAVAIDDETRARLKAIEADIRATVPSPDAPVPARDVIASLQQAADRLRAAAEDELARIEPDAPAAPEEAAQEDAAPRAEVVDEGAAATDTDADVVDVGAAPPDAAPVVVDAGEDAGDATATAAPAPDAAPGAPAPASLGARAIDFGAKESPWVRTAIERLAEHDPARAADLLVALLPAQSTLGASLTYLVTAPTLGAVRVSLAPGSASVERSPAQPIAEARVAGSLATLAPLAAGGAAWRLRGVRVEGARRQVRRLVRARRRPLTFDDVALLDPPLPPGLLLAALAGAVDPAWTRGHRFGVLYVVPGAGRWTISAEDGGPLQLADDERAHSATVELTPGAVLPALQGAPVPRSERATVAGDRRAADVLHTWFDRARGVAAR